MSFSEIEKAIMDWQMNDENAQSPLFCRRSALIMHQLAIESNVSIPLVEINIIASRQPLSNHEQDIHYALRVHQPGQPPENDMIFNPVATPGYPQFNGQALYAPDKLDEMIVVREIL